MFKKILTAVIFSVFVISSLPFFLGLTFANTFFSRSFYTGTFVNTAYDPAVDLAVTNMTALDPALQKYFAEGEIRELFTQHFTKDILREAIDTTSSKFSQDISSGAIDPSVNKKMKIRVDFTPLLNPLKLFLQDLIQRVLDRLPPCAPGTEPQISGIFPSCAMDSWKTGDFKQTFNAQFQKAYEQKVLRTVLHPGQSGFVRDLTLDAPQSDIKFALDQLEKMNMYVVLFILAFVGLMILLWHRTMRTALTLSGLMLIISSALGLVLALILANATSFLSPDAFADPAISQANFDIARDLLDVLLVSFAKVYATILGLCMLLGGAMYFYAHRYLKKS